MNDIDYRVILGERIKAARRQKFHTVDKARVAADIARGTWEKAERGDPIKDFSLAAIESALEWEPGYAQTILRGREPGRSGVRRALLLPESPVRPAAKPGGMDAYLADMEDRIDELAARVARLENGDQPELTEDELLIAKSRRSSGIPSGVDPLTYQFPDWRRQAGAADDFPTDEEAEADPHA